ncbi:MULTISPECIES: UDP-glucose/GDP-mannose dehydrogenase family protein [unclassified Kitasatospora]|uniref:UDP-glucose dehydrogenase family protein n=1 Tax=unclassified Kitasatospora TaxID=2633591 RepID=UPI000710A05C|nr:MULTISPECIES: UDP-glucose/GDP-mannose dehydrogenase family protein [unclassified Kitasatospora]KQV19363.1 UDP-glucose 6-dehydrogenase [Kitasatospora sp. Root107]KRB77618.1 UDP-glucose 6-dehydrogenase [Kitasatospora sp. Root187]
MKPKISVLGTGYLGATHAAGLAEMGFEVIGLDVDAAKVARLARGEVPFHEPGLDVLMRRHTSSGRLRFTTDFAEAAAFADVHFLAVGTPQSAEGGAADLTYLDAAIDALAPHLTRPCLVVGKSTVPVGTAARLTDRLVALAPAGGTVELAWNPEFLREGHAVADTLSPDRIVVGVRSDVAEKLLREVYADILDRGTSFLVTDLATAELVKVAANSFLATKISFINAMAELCETTGADVTMLARAIGQDARIGPQFLNAGVGFGGGCLPKDVRAFRARARELGGTGAVDLLGAVDTINLRARSRVLALARDALGGELAGRRIAVLGAAFKPDTDDVRDSPALDVATAAARAGAVVTVYDPMAGPAGAVARPELDFVPSLEAAVTGADLVLLLTEWDEFRTADPRRLAGWVRTPRLVDGRNALDHRAWAEAGWSVRAPGRVPSAGELPFREPGAA